MKNSLCLPAQIAVSELCINGGVVLGCTCIVAIGASGGMVPQENFKVDTRKLIASRNNLSPSVDLKPSLSKIRQAGFQRLLQIHL